MRNRIQQGLKRPDAGIERYSPLRHLVLERLLNALAFSHIHNHHHDIRLGDTRDARLVYHFINTLAAPDRVHQLVPNALAIESPIQSWANLLVDWPEHIG